MKTTPSALTILLGIVLAFASVQVASPDIASAASTSQSPSATAASTVPQAACDSKRSIQVTGTAVVNVAPDRALIQLGVQSNGTTTAAVEQMNSLATQAVIRAVRSLGVDPADIATDVYVIEPVYESYDSLYIKGYRINNVVAITLKEVGKTTAVISAALRSGANQVLGVDFYTSELRRYRDQARDMAMKAAMEKAQALAESAGAVAGCAVTINENSWSYYNGWWYGRNQGQSQWTQNAVQNIAPSSASSSGSDDEPISIGKISIKAEINATFSLQ